MLIKRFCTREGQSQQMIIEYPTDLQSRHQRHWPSISLHHRAEYHHQRYQLQRQHHRCIFLLIALIFLQHIDVHECHLLAHRSFDDYGDELNLSSSSSSSSSSSAHAIQTDSDSSVMSKRDVYGQPEEIFTVDNQMESNYDEYPMIVPKRAALLLDRLMVSLHRALDREYNQQRKNGELNENRNRISDGAGTNTGGRITNNIGLKLKSGTKQIDNMYGDDPTVTMDYDFKDMNSINREIRRANIGGGSDGLAMLAMKGNSMVSGVSDGVSIGSGRSSNGRTYWRCYFNAVSCF